MFGFGSLGEFALGEIPPQQSQASAAAADTLGRRRKAMYPGGWVPERLHSPPRRKLKEGAVKALKELYEEARETIPEPLQVGLIPADVLIRARATITLPPPDGVDFEKLARSLDAIRVLIAALEAAKAETLKAEADERTKKRRREEEALIIALMELL